ncbi:hypothetical protein ACQ4PT_033546 [Festuca glaucescens]
MVGATSLGRVDLLRGIILLSNIFDDERPVITYIPLPAEKVCITDKQGYPHYAPEYFCDVACDGDLNKFVEIDFEDPDCRANGKAWKATTWNRKVSWDDWRKVRTIDVADISVDPRYSALLFPDLLSDDKKQELELKNLFYLNLTLSVCGDDDLLYMLAKVDEGDDTAWVAAVDMKNAALQALVPVSTKESNAIPMYYARAFPKYYINNITSDEKDKSDKLQQGGPNFHDSVQKKRRKKKQPRFVDHQVFVASNLVQKKIYNGALGDAFFCPNYAPEYFCDVVCDNDRIKFVEIDFEDPDCRANGKAWKATTWHRKVFCDYWRKHRTIDVADISVDPRYSAQLFPDLLLDDKKQELELKNLFFLNPTLSVSGDDDLLYMLAKVDEGDHTAWLAAIDMKNAALQALSTVSTEESNAIPMYYARAFPNYYINNITSDTDY